MKRKKKEAAELKLPFDLPPADNAAKITMNSSAEMQEENTNKIPDSHVSNDSESLELTEPEFVRMEKNIAAFGFFTPTSKRSKDAPPKIIKFTQIIDGNRAEAKVTIAGNTLYGMPTTADQDKYLAFQKILERIKREKGKIENPIAFTSAELLQLLGHSDGGANFREVEEWCDVMASTYIKSEGAMWIAGKRKFASDSFVIFQRVRRTGQELEDGSVADRNYIWLSDWYLENINSYYLLPIDFDTYKQLKNNIAKALIPLLQIWLYASREQGVFEKRYDEICQILNITQYAYRSKIKEKLAPSLNELIRQEYLSSWEVGELSGEAGYKLVFYHGKKFYQDQVKRLRKAQLLDRHELTETTTKAADTAPSRKKNSSRKLSPAENKLVGHLTRDFSVSAKKARELVLNFGEDRVRRQIDAFPFRRDSVQSMAGFLIRAVEQDFSLPEGYLESLKKNERAAAEKKRAELIADCRFCDESGYRNLKSDRDPFYGILHECTHDASTEEQFEEHTL